MSVRARLILAVVWVMSLAGVAAIAQPGPGVPQPPAPGVVVSGDDLGFRIESADKGAITGTLVVRLNGQWVPVDHVSNPQVRPLITTR